MKRISIWMTAVLLGMVSTVAAAQSAAEQFRHFAATFAAATGKFEQYTVSSSGQTQKAQSGEFAFQRPGRFRWDVQQPYAQLVISDGKQVFQYDPDLNQATVRPVGTALSSSPAAILFGDVALEDAFTLTPQPDADGMSWLRAVPHQPDSGLNQIDIGLHQGMPARLLLRDSFGQTTRIDLSRMRAQSGFSADTFQFKPPQGTDIIKVQ